MAAIVTADPLQVKLTSRYHYEIKQHLKVLRQDQLISLGTALGLDYNNLRSKEAEYLLGDLISGWLNMGDYVKEVSGTPCWASLIKALEDEGHRGIASMIKESKVSSSHQGPPDSYNTADTSGLPNSTTGHGASHIRNEIIVGEKRKRCTKSTSPDIDSFIFIPTTKQPAISAISQYAVYLKGVYRNSPISPDSKWPPTPSKKYVNLATVEHGYKCRDEFIGHTLHGDIKKILLKSRKEISIDEILVPDEEGVAYLKLILIEGAPGIGKSTLAWELCRKWEQGCMEKYSLTVLLRLREKEVQEIRNISELLFSSSSKYKDVLLDEIYSRNGKGVLFILDGFDELPTTLQKEGFLVNFIKGIFLPECTVLVTSRPSATAELFTICRPQLQKHIEVLGFTQQSVEEYATSIFSSEPERLQGFKAFILASNNPAINSLMYVPLNAAIIVEIYRHSRSDHLLPHTLTQVYTQLCLTILSRYLRTNFPSVIVNKFKDLPCHLYQEFVKLSGVAFSGMRKQDVIFHTVPSNLVHFGFLDSVSSLYGGGSVSYNFLHLTLQEFFAAYHISQLNGDARLALLREYGSDSRWNVVWRFVAGLTEFKFFDGYLNLFVVESQESKVVVKPLFVQCLFEANIKIDSSKLFGQKHIIPHIIPHAQPLDMYALGYCIANLTSEVSWNLSVVETNMPNLLDGLRTNDVRSNSNVKRLEFGPLYLSHLKHFPLHGITDLILDSCIFTASDHFTELLLSMTSLKRLSIEHCTFHTDSFPLQQLSQTNVTSLNIVDINFPGHVSVLQSLIDPQTGTLKELRIGRAAVIVDDTLLLDLVCAPSSLKFLQILYPINISSLTQVQTNTCLTKLELMYPFDVGTSQAVDIVIGILEHNKTLEHLLLRYFELPKVINALREIIEALANSTLSSLVIEIHQLGAYKEYENASDYIRFNYPELNCDLRVSYSYSVKSVW